MKASWESIGITLILASFTNWLGILAVPIYTLFLFNVLDYITGIAAAKYRNKKISSYYGMMGIAKKVFMYVLIIVAVGLELIIHYAIQSIGLEFNYPYIGGAFVAIWLVLNEAISILENLDDMKVKMPPFLMPFIKRIRGELEEKATIKEEGEKDADKRD